MPGAFRATELPSLHRKSGLGACLFVVPLCVRPGPGQLLGLWQRLYLAVGQWCPPGVPSLDSDPGLCLIFDCEADPSLIRPPGIRRAVGFGQGMASTPRVTAFQGNIACSFLFLQGWPCVAETGPVIGWRDLTKAESWLLWPCVASSLRTHLLWRFSRSLSCFKARDVEELLPGCT